MVDSGRRAWSWRQLLLKSSLPGTTRHVLLTLSCHVNDAGEPCYPSVADLVTETGLSKQTVLTHLERAEQAGWIRIRRHGFSGQKWARNEYALAWPDDKVEPEGGQAVGPPCVEGGQAVRPKAVKEVDRLDGSPIYTVFPSIPNNPLALLPTDVGDVPFDRWWAQYPKHRRVAKARCKRMWLRKGLNASAEQVLLVLAADVASEQWRKADGQFVPLPMTWLNQDRFERDVEAMKPQQRVCVVCAAEAHYRIGGRALCAAHFREKGND